MIDSGTPGWPEAQLSIPAYPLVGVNKESLATILQVLGSESDELELVPTPGRLRQMLQASARHLDEPPAKVGAGFVSSRTTREYLQRFDGRELARLCLSRRGSADSAGLGLPLANPSEIDHAIQIWDRGSLHVYYDQDTREVTLN
jgi:hypothetical protein